MEYYNNKALEVILKYEKSTNENTVTLNNNQKYINENLVEFINVFRGFIDELREENKLIKEDLKLIKSVFNINNELVVRKTSDSVTMHKTDAEMIDLLSSKLSRFRLSNSAYNRLTRANVKTIADLVQMTKKDVMNIRLFGKKCFAELEQILEEYNIYFEMDISRYKPHLELNTK